jgi:hypothetical protein
MNSLNFAYWLNGFFEINGVADDMYLTPSQVKTIREHLALMFTKVTGAGAAPAPWTPVSPPAPVPLPNVPYPAMPLDWRLHEVICAAGEPLARCTVTDDVEAAITVDESPLGQNLGGAGRSGRPFSFAPTQVGGWAAPASALPSSPPVATPTGGIGSPLWPFGSVFVGPKAPPTC